MIKGKTLEQSCDYYADFVYKDSQGNLCVIKTQIVVEYISLQPTIKETGKKQSKSNDEDFGDGEIEFTD